MPSAPAPDLASLARSPVAPGKGLLAIDESFPAIGKRFAALGLASTDESRRSCREILLTAPGPGECVSGVILHDETLRQFSSAGPPFPEMLARQGIIPGIKVDLGAVAPAIFPGEKITAGLDGLRERLSGYRDLGARFTKWRAVFAVAALALPTAACVAANARQRALFAALSQEAGLMPVVEPEILMEGDHPLGRCEEAMHTVLEAVFGAPAEHRVSLGGLLLKTAVVLPGTASRTGVADEEIAAHTLRCLRRAVPAAVPGILFLSGGQSPAEATARLGAIHRAGTGPWSLTYSFGRALLAAALCAWGGHPENKIPAQRALVAAVRENSRVVGLVPIATAPGEV